MPGQYLLTIDGGTTNTRYVLWDRSGKVIHSSRQETGVRVSAVTGSADAYRKNLAEGIRQILEQKQISDHEIRAVYASGMITSSLGLMEVPHIPAPAGIDELASAAVSCEMPDVWPRPIFLIPGVKNAASNTSGIDMMRGEETEVIALLKGLSKRNCAASDAGSSHSLSRLIILPGSHNKFIWVSPEGKILRCRTTLSGELIDAVSHHTILADAVEHSFAPSDYDSQWLLAGAEASDAKSLTAALFETRIHRMFDGLSGPQAASFLLGAVLAEDLKVCSADTLPDEIIVAGKDPLRSAIASLLKEKSLSRIREYIPESKPLAGYGALLIAREKGDF